MKYRTQWLAAVLVAGSTSLALAVCPCERKPLPVKEKIVTVRPATVATTRTVVTERCPSGWSRLWSRMTCRPMPVGERIVKTTTVYSRPRPVVMRTCKPIGERIFMPRAHCGSCGF